LVRPDDLDPPPLPEAPPPPLPVLADLVSPRNPSSPFEQFLLDAKVFDYIDAFHDYGVETLEELREMDDEDFDSIGLKPFYRKRLVQMIGRLRQGDEYASHAVAVPSDNESDGHADSLVLSPEVQRGDVVMSPYGSHISPRKQETPSPPPSIGVQPSPRRVADVPVVQSPRKSSETPQPVRSGSISSPRGAPSATTPRAGSTVSPRVVVAATTPRKDSISSPRNNPPEPSSPRNVAPPSSPRGPAEVAAAQPQTSEAVPLPVLTAPEPSPAVEKVRKLHRRRTRKSKRHSRNLSDTSPTRTASEKPQPEKPQEQEETKVAAVSQLTVVEEQETRADLPSPRAESSGELSSSEEEGVDNNSAAKEGLRKTLADLENAMGKKDDMALLRGARECTAQAIAVCELSNEEHASEV